LVLLERPERLCRADYRRHFQRMGPVFVVIAVISNNHRQSIASCLRGRKPAPDAFSQV
jgi:hypothetical protein